VRQPRHQRPHHDHAEDDPGDRGVAHPDRLGRIGADRDHPGSAGESEQHPVAVHPERAARDERAGLPAVVRQHAPGIGEDRRATGRVDPDPADRRGQRPVPALGPELLELAFRRIAVGDAEKARRTGCRP
jgi:hypothetical protein